MELYPEMFFLLKVFLRLTDQVVVSVNRIHVLFPTIISVRIPHHLIAAFQSGQNR